MDRITTVTAYSREAPITLAHDPDGMPFAKSNGWQVEAVTERGDVYVHTHTFADQATAANVAARIAQTGSIDHDYWTYSGPAYGSQAYSEDGGEEALMAFEAEAEQWGPPAYAL